MGCASSVEQYTEATGTRPASRASARKSGGSAVIAAPRMTQSVDTSTGKHSMHTSVDMASASPELTTAPQFSASFGPALVVTDLSDSGDVSIGTPQNLASAEDRPLKRVVSSIPTVHAAGESDSDSSSANSDPAVDTQSTVPSLRSNHSDHHTLTQRQQQRRAAFRNRRDEEEDLEATHLELENENILRAAVSSVYVGRSVEIQWMSRNLKEWPELIPPGGDASRLIQLRRLIVSRNHLTSFPACLHLLGDLVKLDISNNNLSQLPTEISELKKLEYLNLSRNQLAMLPSSMSACVRLENLYLDDMYFTQIPDVVFSLRRLRTLSMQGNIDLHCNPKQRLHDLPKLLELFNRQIDDLALKRLRCKLLGSEESAPDDDGQPQLEILLPNHPFNLCVALTSLARYEKCIRDPNGTIASLPTLPLGYYHVSPTLASSLPVIFTWDRTFPDEVLRGVFIGSVRTVSSRVIDNLGVSHVLTCGTQREFPDLDCPSWTRQLYCVLDDDARASIARLIPDAIAFIDDALGTSEAHIRDHFSDRAKVDSLLPSHIEKSISEGPTPTCLTVIPPIAPSVPTASSCTNNLFLASPNTRQYFEPCTAAHRHDDPETLVRTRSGDTRHFEVHRRHSLEEKLCGGVVIHCFRGASRSAAVLAAYLIQQCRYTCAQALELMTLRHPDTAPNSGFVNQLQAFEAECRKNQQEEAK